MPRPAKDGCLFLAFVVFCSALPYILNIGFYTDDWAYLSVLVANSHESLLRMFQALMASDSTMLVRPVQVAYLVLSFKAFGLHPLPYHIVNTAVLAAATSMVYLLFRELGWGRLLALSTAAVFGLLPHYSPDRFWISVHNVTLSMAFALLGIYAVSKATRRETGSPVTWTVVATVSLTLSVLSYEIVLGLIGAAVLFVALRTWIDHQKDATNQGRKIWPVVVVMIAMLVAGLVKFTEQSRIIYHHQFYKHLGALGQHGLSEMVRFCFWTYVVKMPEVLRSLSRNSALRPTAVWVSIFLMIFVGAYLWRRLGACDLPGRRSCVILVTLGVVTFFLGYILFAADLSTDFSATGPFSRVTMASALGAACVLVGVVGIICSLLRQPESRVKVYSLTIALACGLNCLVVNGNAFYWVDASARQSIILAKVAERRQSFPTGSVFLLEGFCRFSGPALVLDNYWDATGALRIVLHDMTIAADVVVPNMRFADAGVFNPEGEHYPYGSNLFIYNTVSGVIRVLSSAEAARYYVTVTNPGCPAVDDAKGVQIY